VLRGDAGTPASPFFVPRLDLAEGDSYNAPEFQNRVFLSASAMTHLLLYAFSLTVFTVALFTAGLMVGQAIERTRSARRSRGGYPGRMARR
jgi:hypothetical protein